MTSRIAALTLALLLGACAATVDRQATDAPTLQVADAARKRIVLVVLGASATVASASDWEAFRGEWRSAMAEAAAAAGIAYEFADRAPAAGGAPGTLATVTVADYRYLSTGARIGLGVMTGNAYVDAQATFAELPSGRNVATRRYNTSSSAWQGVFAPMTSKQVRALCDEIVREVARR